MSTPKSYFFVGDKTDSAAYFAAVVFPDEQIAVTFPADPTNNAGLQGWAAADRREKIAEAAEDKGVKINWTKWVYYEVSPFPEHNHVRKYAAKVVRGLLKRPHAEWEEAMADDQDMATLDAVAMKAGLPTIGEYYRQVCEDRESTKSLEDAAHKMISKWTNQWPSTAELLAQLKSDEDNRMYLVEHYKHGWYYIVQRGKQEAYFRTKNTRTLLRSFILHAEEAENNGELIRFAYVLREYMPEGIDWQPSPA